MNSCRIKNVFQIGAVAALVLMLGATTGLAQKDDLFDKVGKALANPARPKKSGQDEIGRAHV